MSISRRDAFFSVDALRADTVVHACCLVHFQSTFREKEKVWGHPKPRQGASPPAPPIPTSFLVFALVTIQQGFEMLAQLLLYRKFIFV